MEPREELRLVAPDIDKPPLTLGQRAQPIGDHFHRIFGGVTALVALLSDADADAIGHALVTPRGQNVEPLLGVFFVGDGN